MAKDRVLTGNSKCRSLDDIYKFLNVRQARGMGKWTKGNGDNPSKLEICHTLEAVACRLNLTLKTVKTRGAQVRLASAINQIRDAHVNVDGGLSIEIKANKESK